MLMKLFIVYEKTANVAKELILERTWRLNISHLNIKAVPEDNGNVRKRVSVNRHVTKRGVIR